MAPRRWTNEMLARMVDMREVQKLKWDVIGAAFGVTGACACTRYNYHRSELRVAKIRAESSLPAPRSPSSDGVPAVPVPGPKRPRYFHDADADISGRIARQGITAGFFGDPPPGRSALDFVQQPQKKEILGETNHGDR